MNVELEISTLMKELQKLGFSSIEEAQNWVTSVDITIISDRLRAIEDVLTLLKIEKLPSLTELEMELKMLEKEKKELGIDEKEIENVDVKELITEIKTLQRELDELKI